VRQPEAWPIETCKALLVQKSYDTCVHDAKELFLKMDYSEMKDLGKTFLTLVVAAFVASITFSEKIVDVKSGSLIAKVAMVTSWTLMLGSVCSCGLGIIYIAFALGKLTYGDRSPFRLELRSQCCMAIAGAMFVCALGCLLVAALPALLERGSTTMAFGDDKSDRAKAPG
jgi:hypothetical protein